MKSSSSNLPDQYFINNFQKGKKEAFEGLFHRYKIKIYNLALKILKNHEEAEEITQEVYVRAFSSLNKFQGRSEFSTWIYRIAYNLCQDRVKVIQKSDRFRNLDLEFEFCLSTLQLGAHNFPHMSLNLLFHPSRYPA